MGLKKLKDQASKSNFLTGAARATATISLAVALAMGIPTVAHADVPASYIVGDAEVSESRSDIKIQDGIDIKNYFEGYDNYGNPNVTTEEIRKAIELSNVLNGYYLSPLHYTNTTKNEVLNLNVDNIYYNYQIAPYTNGSQAFCDNNLVNKPAIDAYTLFGCGTVSNNIKNIIAANIYSMVSYEHPYSNITFPTIVVNSNEAYAVFKVDGVVEKVYLYGDIIDSVKTLCVALDNRYNMAINNLSGYSNEYENSFAYNGIDRYTNESVWLSFPDESRKTDLTSALDFNDKINNYENFDYSIEAPTSALSLTRAEKEELKNLGYSDYSLRYATKRNAYFTSSYKYTFNN